MTRFYCDRCGAEVEGPDDLIEITAESHERPSMSSWGCRAEMCRTCFDAAKEGVIQLLGTADDAKKKSRRSSN